MKNKVDFNIDELEMNIEARHLFMLSEILNKTEFKIDEGSNINTVSFNMIGNIVKGLYKAEKEVYNFINDVYGFPEGQKLPLKQFIQALKRIFKHEDFQEVLSLLK